MRGLTNLRRRDQRAVRCESRVGRREIRVPRHCRFDCVRQIHFFIRRKVPETQLNFSHFSPVRLRRGRVIVHEPAIVRSNRIVEWHARALVNFALLMPGNRPAINTY